MVEIILEKKQGWASGLSQNGIGKRLFRGKLFVRLIEKPYITVYHLLMVGGVIPLTLGIECSIIRRLWVDRSFMVCHSALLTVWQAGSVRFLPLFSCIAAWLTICATEDFLWFGL
jgi:hypothetical protein